MVVPIDVHVLYIHLHSTWQILDTLQTLLFGWVISSCQTSQQINHATILHESHPTFFSKIDKS